MGAILMKFLVIFFSLSTIISCTQNNLPLEEAIKSSTFKQSPPATSPTPPPAGTTSNGVGLRLHPDNPRFFQDIATGEAVLAASFFNIVPSDLSHDYNSDLALIKSHTSRYARIWHLLPWAGTNAIWPWARSSVGGAPMGGNKIDFNKWDTQYWTRMTDALKKATDAKIVSEIMLFERCGMSPAAFTRWESNAWASDNNINGLETPIATADGTPEFYQYKTRPKLREQQERYIMKMIDETIKYNVIYEIENEHWENNDPDFGDHYAQFVKNYMRNKYPTMQRLVSHSSLDDDLELFYNIPSVDIVNVHFGKEPERRPELLNEYVTSHWGSNKPVNVDEFANDLADPEILRKMSWLIVSGGGHFHIEDTLPSSKPWETVDNINQFLALSRWDFVHSGPNNAVSPSGFCMIQEGKEYMCYYPSGGAKTFELPAGSYKKTWWDPINGGFVGTVNFQHSSGVHNLSSPNTKDWVLHITKN